MPLEYKLEALTKSNISFETVNYWKSKYFELLEQYKVSLHSNKLLLENNLKEYFNKNMK